MSLAAQSAAVLLQSFSTSWRMFCIMFLFIGASQISLYISAFVLGRELQTDGTQLDQSAAHLLVVSRFSGFTAQEQRC